MTWLSVNNGLPAGNLSFSLKQATGNPQIVYAAAFNNSAFRVDSLYRTVDGGANWKPINNGLPTTTELFLVRGIEIDSLNAEIVYLATTRGVYKTENGGNEWKITGLTRNTDNVYVDSTNSGIIYANNNLIAGLYRSADGGTTWQLMENLLSRNALIELKAAPTQPLTFHARILSSHDIYLGQLSQDGQALIKAGYTGSLANETVTGFAVDRNNNILLTGTSAYTNILQNDRLSSLTQAFVWRLNSQYQPDFKQQFENNVAFNDLVVDSSNRIYVTGSVTGNPFAEITTNGLQPAPGGSSDAFVLGIDPQQSPENSIFYATYLGGSGIDTASRIAIGQDGSIYVAGRTQSTDFPLSANTFQKSPGYLFVTRFHPARQGQASLIYSSRLGGRLETAPTSRSSTRIAELISDLEVDASGNAYVSGASTNTGFPSTPGSYQPTAGGGNTGSAYACSGSTDCYCPDQTQINPFLPRCKLDFIIAYSASDGFLSVITPSGSSLSYSTYVGKKDTDETINALTLDAAGNVYLAGGGTIPQTDGAATVSPGTGFLMKLTADTSPRSTLVTALSAANYRGPNLAPEAIAAGFLSVAGEGSDKLKATVTDSTGTERSAYMFYSGPGQVNFQIPPGTATGSAIIRVNSNDAAVAASTFQVVNVAPGLFTADASGSGLAAAFVVRVKPDNLQIYESIIKYDATLKKFVSIPIDFGPDLGSNSDQMFLALFGTGFRFRSSEANVRVTVGGLEVPVTYAGSQLQLIGLDQINLRLPRTLIGKGEVDIVVTVDGITANPVRVSFK